MKNILKGLLAFRSEEGNTQAKKEICEYVASLFENTGFFIEHFENDGIYSVTISSKNTRKVDYIFSGHLDVVPADEETWKFKEDDTYFYGRGTLDMKGGCAGMIHTFLTKKEEILTSEKSFLLMFTTDEELGGARGVEYLVQKEGFEAQMVYIPDTGAGMDKYLKTGKGFIFGEITITGEDGHGCRPWKKPSAVDTFVPFYNELYSVFPKAHDDESGWKHTSINIGKLEGGLASNQIMSKLVLSVDIRFHPENSLEDIRKKLQSVTEKFPNIEFNEKFNFGGFQVDTNAEYVKKYLETIDDFYDGKIQDEREYGSNDGRFFTHLTQNIIMTGPFGHGYHGPNENVSKQELENFYQIFSKYIEKLI
ncbi:M20/M25/M40 family metallo-hydrolase [Candidatus Gracilibacteria bacterium]|nr:M20/M25/M40 family metallo-hydrolase [Candidatus Gracilibacteria bacterium]